MTPFIHVQYFSVTIIYGYKINLIFMNYMYVISIVYCPLSFSRCKGLRLLLETIKLQICTKLLPGYNSHTMGISLYSSK